MVWDPETLDWNPWVRGPPLEVLINSRQNRLFLNNCQLNPKFKTTKTLVYIF